MQDIYHDSSSNMLQRCLESQADSFFNHSEKLLWVMFVLLFFRFKILDFWYFLLMSDLHLAPWALHRCSLNLLQTLHCDISLDSVICHRLLFHGFSFSCWIQLDTYCFTWHSKCWYWLCKMFLKHLWWIFPEWFSTIASSLVFMLVWSLNFKWVFTGGNQGLNWVQTWLSNNPLWSNQHYSLSKMCTLTSLKEWSQAYRGKYTFPSWFSEGFGTPGWEEHLSVNSSNLAH